MIRQRPHLEYGLGLILLAGLAATAQAEPPRVLAPGKLPDDCRLEPLKTLNGYFPFTPPASQEAWSQRAERVRRQILVATGLWPMPTRTPANAVIHGKVDRGEYTVERVFLESFPGFFVTGSLYRPKGRQGKLPGVLCPHGHWPDGRFYDAGEKELQQQLIAGAERFDPAGRYPIQARCVQLARMGCIVFQYDMVGYADSVQLSHGPGYRERMNTAENWGYFSPQAESHQENMMGLQTYDSLRTLDWFLTLPDVDPKRIGVTGASGGGTQTFILCAIDPRPAVAFPAVMVSTAMQGGCTCENACYLRVDTGNVEIAGLTAPRPMGMTNADDWTKEFLTKGLPELKQLYRLLGAEDLVMAKAFVHFPHNYNYVSRAVMYPWFNKHLKLGWKEPIVEQDFKPLTRTEMTVWDAGHPKPKGGDDFERSLLRWITEDSQKQMESLVPRDADGMKKYREVVGGAIDVMVGHGIPNAGSVRAARRDEKYGEWTLSKLLVQLPERHEELPALVLKPKNWNHRAVIWLDRQGKHAMWGQDGKVKPAIEKLLAGGAAVVGVDLFGQGEFTPDGKPIAKARYAGDPSKHWDKYAGYTWGYNHPVFSQRVQDVLTVVSYAKGPLQATKVDVVGLGGAGHWVAAARAQAGEAIDRAAIDTAGFRFASIKALNDPDFLPGGAKYLDLPGIVALSAPEELWLSDAGAEAAPVIRAAYQATGSLEKLNVYRGDAAGQADAAVEWLLR